MATYFPIYGTESREEAEAITKFMVEARKQNGQEHIPMSLQVYCVPRSFDAAYTRMATDTLAKINGVAINLVASCDRQSGVAGQFDCKKRSHAAHQSPLKRRLERSRTRNTHASCARLTGQKRPGRRGDDARVFGCKALTAGCVVTPLGVDACLACDTCFRDEGL